MSNNYVLGCGRNFLEAQLGKESVKLAGTDTRRILDLASYDAMMVNTNRLEHHSDQSLRLSAFSVIMKRYRDQITFMVLGRENGNFSIGLIEEIPLPHIVYSQTGSCDISITESLLRADSVNRRKVELLEDGKYIVIPTVYPIGFVRGGFELTKKYTRNVGVLFAHVIKFNSFLIYEQPEEKFNGVTWMSQEQLEEFHKDSANIFDPWSNELIKNLDKFVTLVNQTA